MNKINRFRGSLFLLTATTAMAFASHASADTVLGNWESAAPEGWIDWSSAQIPIGAPRFEFNAIGATLGTGAVQFNLPATGFTQWASLKLQMGSNGVDEWRDDFLANTKLAVDITLVASEMGPEATNDFAAIGMVVNAEGYGFTSQGNPESVTPFTGYNGGNSFNPRLLSGTQTSTWVWDIADTHDGIDTEIAAAPNWIELIFDTYSNGAVVYHIDNVRLFTPSLLGDFDNNNVVDGADLVDKWKPGYGMTGQTDDSNGDANADGGVDGDDFLIWQQQNGATAVSVGAIAAVPEPATLGLLLASLATASAVRRAAARGRIASSV